MAHRRQSDTLQRARDQRRNPTRAEQILWAALRGKKLQSKKFRRQHIIGGYIVDFFCPECKLVIEVDGQHHDEADVIWNDEKRTQQLEDRGHKVIRFSNKDVIEDLPSVLTAISNMLT